MSPLLIALLGCQEPAEEATGLATVWVDAPGHTGTGFHDADRAVNGVRGGGDGAGSTDVFSVALTDDHLVLGWGGARLFDDEGPDFVVFENPFDISSGTGRFMDATLVEVSPDGEAWLAFPCEAEGEDPHDPGTFFGCAGIEPVGYHEESNPVDPLSADAGGDAFDLAALPPGPLREQVLDQGVLLVRLSAAEGPRDPVANGPDIDGIYAH